MILIAQNRKLDMHAVFFHLLGPLQWYLENRDGNTKGKNAAHAKYLENMESAENIAKSHETLIDAMALIQKLHGESHAFEEISDHISQSSLVLVKEVIILMWYLMFTGRSLSYQLSMWA